MLIVFFAIKKAKKKKGSKLCEKEATGVGKWFPPSEQPIRTHSTFSQAFFGPETCPST